MKGGYIFVKVASGVNKESIGKLYGDDPPVIDIFPSVIHILYSGVIKFDGENKVINSHDRNHHMIENYSGKTILNNTPVKKLKEEDKTMDYNELIFSKWLNFLKNAFLNIEEKDIIISKQFIMTGDSFDRDGVKIMKKMSSMTEEEKEAWEEMMNDLLGEQYVGELEFAPIDDLEFY